MPMSGCPLVLDQRAAIFYFAETHENTYFEDGTSSACLCVHQDVFSTHARKVLLTWLKVNERMGHFGFADTRSLGVT